MIPLGRNRITRIVIAPRDFRFFFIRACLSPDTDLVSLSIEHLCKKQQGILCFLKISQKIFSVLQSTPRMGNRKKQAPDHFQIRRFLESYMQLYLWYGPSDFTSHQLPCSWKAYPSIIEVYQRDCPIIPTHLCIFPCFIYGSLLQCWRIKHNQRSMHQNCCSPLMGLWQFFYFSAS